MRKLKVFSRFLKKNDPLQWEWKKTKDVPLKLEDFGLAGKILKNIGLGEVTDSLLGVYNSSVKMAEKPSLSSAVDIGLNLGKAVKGSMDAYKSGVKGAVKEGVKNTAKDIVGGKKMSLGEEFLMDAKDHQKKLSKFEEKTHNISQLQETLEGLRKLTNNGLEHIEKLENILELKGGSAKSQGFIRAIMWGKDKKPGNESSFKKYTESGGFDEKKLKQASRNVIQKKFTKDLVFKDFVLLCSYPAPNLLYNVGAMKKIYDEYTGTPGDKKEFEKIITDLKNILLEPASKSIVEKLKKLFKDKGEKFDDLDPINKAFYINEAKKQLITDTMKNNFDAEPIINKMDDSMLERALEAQARYRAKKTKNKAVLEIFKKAKEEGPQNIAIKATKPTKTVEPTKPPKAVELKKKTEKDELADALDLLIKKTEKKKPKTEEEEEEEALKELEDLLSAYD